MNEAEIPIDIHTLKLQDWLVSRRIVPKNSQAPIREIRAKIANAIKDVPATNILEGQNINYYHCKQVVELLKETEKDKKTVFGTYDSQRMKNWQEVIRMYEKNALYLAEAAQIFVRNVNYEIPSLRKQSKNWEQQSADCLKRVQDLGKPEAQLIEEHKSLLQQLGVKGENLKEEFKQVLNTLPELYELSITQIGDIEDAIELYAVSCGSQKPTLPVLRHLVKFGNTTVYQYLYKEAPLEIEAPSIELNMTIEAVEPVGSEIDFDVDYDIGNTATIDNEEIDWGIVDTATDDTSLQDCGIVVTSSGANGRIARGEHAHTLLDSPNYRERILDELCELEAFLRMRLFELSQSDTSSNIMLSMMDGVVFSHDATSITAMLAIVQKIVAQINTDQIRHLFQLKHSPKYADLLVAKLKQMTKAVDKIRTTQSTLKERSIELNQQRQILNEILEKLIAQTKQLQRYIEMDISKRYKNRVVNLIGGVN